jgi:S1-C subfamily serine protease
VKAQLRVVSGAKAGLVQVFSEHVLALGRHPSADLRFDPTTDLDVSARHASIMQQGGRWYVRDVGSSNGTFVNGHRIERETALGDTDVIQLGTDGPKIEFRLVPDTVPDGVLQPAEAPQAPADSAAAVAATGSSPAGGRPPRDTAGRAAPAPTTPAAPRGMSTTQRIRIEVGRQTRSLRVVSVMLIVSLVAVGAIFVWNARRQEARRALEIAAIQARTDSILRSADDALRSLQGQVQGLAGALERSQGEVSRLQTALVSAGETGNSDDVAQLRRQLDSATQTLGYQQMAARVDYRQIVGQNQRAVAMVWVDFGPGEVYTGTAFAVRPNAVMLTNRHVVAGADGTRRPSRIAVRFADSDQTWPARVLAVSRDADVAVIQVEGITGTVPTVRLNTRPDTVRQGDPVAMIGFPLGEELPMSGGIARTTFSAGSVSKSLSDLVQVDGYAAVGASGSPILDQNGEVIAVLYGGQAESGGRIVYGAPATYALRLLESIGQ